MSRRINEVTGKGGGENENNGEKTSLCERRVEEKERERVRERGGEKEHAQGINHADAA